MSVSSFCTSTLSVCNAVIVKRKEISSLTTETCMLFIPGGGALRKCDIIEVQGRVTHACSYLLSRCWNGCSGIHTRILNQKTDGQVSLCFGSKHCTWTHTHTHTLLWSWYTNLWHLKQFDPDTHSLDFLKIFVDSKRQYNWREARAHLSARSSYSWQTFHLPKTC